MKNILLNNDLKNFLDEKFDNIHKKLNYLEDSINNINLKYENKQKHLKNIMDRKIPNGRY